MNMMDVEETVVVPVVKRALSVMKTVAIDRTAVYGRLTVAWWTLVQCLCAIASIGAAIVNTGCSCFASGGSIVGIAVRPLFTMVFSFVCITTVFASFVSSRNAERRLAWKCNANRRRESHDMEENVDEAENGCLRMIVVKDENARSTRDDARQRQRYDSDSSKVCLHNKVGPCSTMTNAVRFTQRPRRTTLVAVAFAVMALGDVVSAIADVKLIVVMVYTSWVVVLIIAFDPGRVDTATAVSYIFWFFVMTTMLSIVYGYSHSRACMVLFTVALAERTVELAMLVGDLASVIVSVGSHALVVAIAARWTSELCIESVLHSVACVMVSFGACLAVWRRTRKLSLV